MSRSLGALTAVPNACLLAWGWRRRLLALVAGAISALAFPPYGFLPVLFLTFPCFVWILDGAIENNGMSVRRRFQAGFAAGWWFGFGFFLGGLWWIGSAFLVEADRFAWMIPFAVLLMPIGLALFTGLGTGVAAVFWSDHWSRILALALFLSSSDWIRGYVLTGFPWNAFGYAFSGSLMLTQTASIFGLYGLSFLGILIFALPATLTGENSAGRRVFSVVSPLLLLGAMALFGAYRLHIAADPGMTETDIRIVQPAIPQEEKWLPDNKAPIFQTLLDLTEKPLGGSGRVGRNRLVVWPESAVPFLLTEEPGALFRISQALSSEGGLITGAIRFAQTPQGPAYFNSVYTIDHDGGVGDIYDKVRLVPFGEYLPMRAVLEWLGIERLVDAPGAFHAGHSHRGMKPQVGPSFLPLICYEAIFPQYAVSDGERPGFLLNVTNDAWFGDTAGPYQHFAQARMRAIEQGLPLVRAANTGISAVVDAKGRILSSMPLLAEGVLDSPLPKSLGPTIYGRMGDACFGLIAILSFVLLSFHRYNPSSRRN